MTDRRSILLFWALFMLPALIMAGAAARLLFHEQERIGRSALLALTQRAETLAESIHLTVETVRDNLVRSLMDIEPDQLEMILTDWAKTHPLVRNVFIFNEGKGLVLLPREPGTTMEERMFVNRYEALFSGRVSFQSVSDQKGLETIPTGTDDGFAEAPEPSPRKELAELSRMKGPGVASPAPIAQAPDNRPDAGQSMSGWLPWFVENRMHVLVWVRQPADGPIYGLELEVMALLSRIVTDFPRMEQARSSLVLTDSQGLPIHQSGSRDLSSNLRPSARIPVSRLLPHWHIAVYPEDPAGPGTGKGFLILSLILVGVFLAAILSGGILLTRMTLQKIRDAGQKTSFVSSVSHELKTPLTSIRMYAELLQSGRVTDPDKKNQYLAVMVSESDRLTRLINNVLDFGRLEQGRKIYRMTDLDLKSLLLQVIGDHQIRISDRGLAVETDIRDGDYRVCADRDALEQVILNLIDNVLKYAGDGRFIRVSLQASPDGTVLMKITDDGPGVPKSFQEKIFQRFYRMDQSLTAAQPGSGLGLSIAQKILRDMGGDLYYEPVKPNGACFTARMKRP